MFHMRAGTRTPERKRTLRTTAAAVLMLLSSAMLGMDCSGEVRSVFRQTATRDIGEGVKQFLGGEPDQAVETIMFATVDGLVAGIEQAGGGSGLSR